MAVRRFPVRGYVDMATVPDLQRELDPLISATDADIVLDCDGLEFIDSTGIRLFLGVHRALEAQGRACHVENMSSRCRRPFDILGLSERFGLGELDPV